MRVDELGREPGVDVAHPGRAVHDLSAQACRQCIERLVDFERDQRERDGVGHCDVLSVCTVHCRSVCVAVSF